MKIKIYGERNCCNNYLIKLLEVNLNVKGAWEHHTKNILGWTHGFPKPKTTEDYFFICLVKNPYSWLLSLHRKPHGSKKFRNKYLAMTFDEFLNSQWGNYKNPTILWDVKTKSYANFVSVTKNSMIIHSEELQKDPENILKLISHATKIPFKDKFVNFTNDINSGGNETKDFKRLDYYLKERWKEYLTERHIKIINKSLNRNLTESLGYEML